MDGLKKISLKKALSMLDEKYYLVYTDYNDRIEDEKDIEEIVETGWSETMACSDWFLDSQWDGAKCVMDETFKDYDIEDHYDELIHTIMERDHSDPIKEIVNRTGRAFFYYNLGIDIDDWTNPNGYDDLVEHEAKKIAKHLGIDYEQNKKKLRSVVNNASMGGMLVWLFVADVSDFYGDIKEKFVEISGGALCIMDRINGGGCDEILIGFNGKTPSIKIPFIRENFRVDEAAPGYSYSGDVCGLVMSPYEASLMFTDDDCNLSPFGKQALERSEKEEREIEYDKKWRETGKCTFGDMRITRHKDTPYRNWFPCGNKCTECGTFWID